MALIAASEAHDHHPDHGTLTIRDAEYAEPAEGEERLGLWATDVQPCGTFVRAGIGWLEGAAGDGPLTVRLELHDGPPPPDTWDDVAETPYRNTGGRVDLTWLDGGGDFATLDLGSSGNHRIRAARNRGQNGADTWRLQFWPVPAQEPPRWFVRSRPAVTRGSSGWQSVFGWMAQDLLIMCDAAGGPDGVTRDQLSRWADEHGRPAGWLGGTLWPDPATSLPTGSPERDANILQQLPATRARHAREQEALARLARELGAPAPQSRAEVLPVLVAAGLLAVDDRQRYRVVRNPPRAQDVLDLPAGQVEAMNNADDGNAHRCAASDVVSVALWSGRAPLSTTVAELADRLLMPTADVRSTLRYAERAGLVELEGEESLTLTVTAPLVR